MTDRRKKGGGKVKFIFTISVSSRSPLFHLQHHLCFFVSSHTKLAYTIGPLIIILVPENSKCSSEAKKNGEGCKYGQYTTYVDNSYHNKLVCVVLAPGQLLPCPKEAIADLVSKHLLLCSPVQYHQVIKGTCS